MYTEKCWKIWAFQTFANCGR